RAGESHSSPPRRWAFAAARSGTGPARERGARSSCRIPRHLQVEEDVLPDQLDHGRDALTGLAVGEDVRLATPHEPRIAVHDLEALSDVRSEIGLVDDQDVRLGDPRAILAGNLVSGSDVDHIDEEIDQGR